MTEPEFKPITVILTCIECTRKVGMANEYSVDYPARILCIECWKELKEKAWKYDDLE